MQASVAGNRSDGNPVASQGDKPKNADEVPYTRSDGPQPTGSAAYAGWMPSYIRGQSKFEGDLFIGLQFDTDANQAVETSVPGQIGQTVTRSTLQKQGDWSFVTKARVKNTYATSAWRGIVWETNAGLSDQRFFRLPHDYDLT